MNDIKAYKGRHSGSEIDDLLDRVPVVESRLEQVEKSVSDKTVKFTISNAKKEWIIDHELGKYPSVTITDPLGNEMVGDVTHTSISRIVIRFNERQKGNVFLN